MANKTTNTSISNLLFLTVIAITVFCSSAHAERVYELEWSDEFDGTSLDTTNNWEYMIGGGGWGNNELQYYTANNTSVSGGYLTIEAREEYYGGRNYTSARIRSKNKQDFLYGRMEAKIKVPTGGGMWPAFWMMPTDSIYGGWAASGEIDIMETRNDTDYIGGTIHYGGSWPDNVHSGNSYSPGGVDFSEAFHVYTLEWEPDVMRWYVDGILYSTKTSSLWYTDAAPTNPQAPFDQYFHFLMNVAVGGTYTGCTSTSCITATFPQEYIVDWVRAYQDMGSGTLVPNLINRVQGSAEARIIYAGLNVGEVGLAFSDTVFAGYVASQYPASGTVVLLGSSVDFNMSLGTPRSDINTDGTVDFHDVSMMLEFWLMDEVSVDIEPVGGDGIVDFRDFAVLADEWAKNVE